MQNSLKKRVSIEKCVFVTGSSIRMHLFIMRYTQTHFSLPQIKVLSSARFIRVLLSVRCVRCTFPNKFNRQKQLQNLWNKCYSKVFFLSTRSLQFYACFLIVLRVFWWVWWSKQGFCNSFIATELFKQIYFLHRFLFNQNKLFGLVSA